MIGSLSDNLVKKGVKKQIIGCGTQRARPLTVTNVKNVSLKRVH